MLHVRMSQTRPCLVDRVCSTAASTGILKNAKTPFLTITPAYVSNPGPPKMANKRTGEPSPTRRDTQNDFVSKGGLASIPLGKIWVAVEELNLRDYIGETLFIPTYTHCGNLIKVP